MQKVITVAYRGKSEVFLDSGLWPYFLTEPMLASAKNPLNYNTKLRKRIYKLYQTQKLDYAADTIEQVEAFNKYIRESAHLGCPSLFTK